MISRGKYAAAACHVDEEQDWLIDNNNDYAQHDREESRANHTTTTHLGPPPSWISTLVSSDTTNKTTTATRSSCTSHSADHNRSINKSTCVASSVGYHNSHQQQWQDNKTDKISRATTPTTTLTSPTTSVTRKRLSPQSSDSSPSVCRNVMMSKDSGNNNNDAVAHHTNIVGSDAIGSTFPKFTPQTIEYNNNRRQSMGYNSDHNNKYMSDISNSNNKSQGPVSSSPSNVNTNTSSSKMQYSDDKLYKRGQQGGAAGQQRTFFQGIYEGAFLLERNKERRSWLQSSYYKFIVLILIAIALCVSSLFVWHYWQQRDHEKWTNYLGHVSTSSKLGKFSRYAVSTDAAHCAPMGRDILARGGSAVDAAITTLLCMGIVLPNSLGLGGGCLMTVYHRKNQTATVIDGREEAPDYAYENMYGDNHMAASRGPLSIGIPGEIAAYGEAHRLFGKLKWAELFEAPIKLALGGAPVVKHMEDALYRGQHSDHLNPELRQLMTSNQTGKLLVAGEFLKRPDLAATLRRLRDYGSQDFYTGEIARLLIGDLQKLGGRITLDNLAKYKAYVKPAYKARLSHNLTLFTQPLPGSGVLLAMILRIMDKFGYNGRSDVGDDLLKSQLYYHRLVETLKFAYAQRGGLDCDTDDERTRQLLHHIESDEFTDSIVAKIDSRAHNVSYYGADEYFSLDHGTAHVSVVDSDGNAVAITSSVNLYFGSGLLSPSTGIIYNDVMDDFVSPGFRNMFGVAPSKYNRIMAGKRPLSSMVPSVFTDANGQPRLVIGASGGSKITSSVALVSLRHLFLGDDIKTAIDGPRLHHQLLPNVITYEPTFPEAILDDLKVRGNEMKPVIGRTSIVMAISVNEACQGHKSNNHTNTQDQHTYCIEANSDYRKGGSVDGM
ncbi:hypothetical protein GZH46_02730, partial [Fragariocoptes setiger]